MKIDFKNSKYYFLTCNNEKRRTHFLEEFTGLDITEVHPVTGIDRLLSGITGFSRMLDKAVSDLKGSSFQPFVLFEDDIKKYRDFPDSMEIPDDADLLYIGLSSYGMSDFSHCHELFYKGIDDNIVRIFNMLSLHGIVFCSIRGVLMFQKCLLESYFKNEPWDITATWFQPYMNVYALRKPLVYQSADLGGQEGPTKIELHSFCRANIPEYWINTKSVALLTSHPDCNAIHPLRM